MAMGIAPQWFNRKRALSQGIISSGVGTGGLVMPFIIDKLNNNLGIQWYVKRSCFCGHFANGIFK